MREAGTGTLWQRFDMSFEVAAPPLFDGPLGPGETVSVDLRKLDTGAQVTSQPCGDSLQFDLVVDLGLDLVGGASVAVVGGAVPMMCVY
jgi:hypothetical protein